MKRLLFAFLLLLTINVCACGKEKNEVTNPPVSNTPEATVTNTLAPTSTPAPTNTLAPTDTPEPADITPIVDENNGDVTVTPETTGEPANGENGSEEPTPSAEPTYWPAADKGFFKYTKKNDKITITGVKTDYVAKEKQTVIDPETGEESEIEVEVIFPSDLYIPDYIDGYPVTKLADKAFYACDAINSVHMPDTITDMGSWTFYECSNLESVELSNALYSVGYAAFGNCISLKDIELPSNITLIASFAFAGCDSLTFMDLRNVNEIGAAAFKHCDNLSNVFLSDTILEIDEYTFENCINLKGIYLPECLLTIKYKAFYNCRSLEEVYLQDVLSIGAYAFWNCHGIKEISFSDALTEIKEYSFYQCSALSKVKFGSSLTTIGQYAFSYTVIKEVELPETCINIDETAFDEGVQGLPEKPIEEEPEEDSNGTSDSDNAEVTDDTNPAGEQ